MSGTFSNRVAVKRFDVPLGLECVVAVPNYQLSTAESRNVLPTKIHFRDAVQNVSAASLLVAAMATGDIELLGIAMQDTMHQPYRMKLVPGLDHAVNLAKQAGAIGVALSGAGPAVIAFCTQNVNTIANALETALREAGTESQTYCLKPDLQGAQILHDSTMDSTLKRSLG